MVNQGRILKRTRVPDYQIRRRKKTGSYLRLSKDKKRDTPAGQGAYNRDTYPQHGAANSSKEKEGE